MLDHIKLCIDNNIHFLINNYKLYQFIQFKNTLQLINVILNYSSIIYLIILLIEMYYLYNFSFINAIFSIYPDKY